MKKFIALFVTVSMILSCVPAFAEETSGDAEVTVTSTQETTTDIQDSTVSSDVSVTNEVNDNGDNQTTAGQDVTTTEETNADSEADAVDEETLVPQEEVDAVVNIDGEEELAATEDAVVEEISNVEQLTKQDLAKVLKNMHKYLVLRDLYYKKILITLDRIQKTDNLALKKAAIIKFEQKYAAQKEKDRLIHHKMKQVMQFLKENKSKLTFKERQALVKIFKPVVTKYQKHRIMLIHIHKKIQNIKKIAFIAKVNDLAQKAEKFKIEGDLKKSKSYYEKALAEGIADENLYKKAGQVLKESEGKGPKVFVHGVRPNFDVKPMIKEGRTMVPFRAIAEALKAKVDWDDKNRIVIMHKGDVNVKIPINQNYIEVNGEQQTIDVPATIVEDRTVVPLRVVSEALDTDVTWDPETEVVTIEDNLTSDSQNIDATEAGMGAVKDTTTEEQVVEEVSTVDEAAVQAEITAVEQVQ